jgi:trk system potassium uptake protein TrkH
VRFEGKTVDSESKNGVTIYIAIFALCYAIAFLLISLEPHGFTTNFTAVATCINNVGPGLGEIGMLAGGSFGGFNVAAKLLLSFDMLLGRLELFPILILFLPSAWSKK